MQIILLEKVRNLGNIGDEVQVKAGFARNFLIPQGKALIANKANLAEFKERRAELEKNAQEQLKAAEERAKKFKDLTLSITMQASEEGKLFGSVGMREIMTAFEDAKLEVERSEITLSAGTIKTLGEHEITLQLHSDLTVPVKINVVAEKIAGNE